MLNIFSSFPCCAHIFLASTNDLNNNSLYSLKCFAQQFQWVIFSPLLKTCIWSFLDCLSFICGPFLVSKSETSAWYVSQCFWTCWFNGSQPGCYKILSGATAISRWDCSMCFVHNQVSLMQTVAPSLSADPSCSNHPTPPWNRHAGQVELSCTPLFLGGVQKHWSRKDSSKSKPFCLP